MSESTQIPSNWPSLKTLVADALELAEAEREAFLARSCNGDEGLLSEARDLVAASITADAGVVHRRTDAWLGLGGPDLVSLDGQRIGRYTLVRLLAEGAMGAVYVATQSSPQRSVALKLVRFNLPMIDAATRFKRESEALGRLEHPNIARIYEAGVHHTSGVGVMPYIAMEFVDGPPLNVYARQKKLDRDDRIRLMIKVALAVHAAHQQAVIHRDLKPANVLVDQSGEPKVLDFGIARIVGADDPNRTWQTTAGVLLGTPGYMSPEQAAGRVDQVDVRSDVWSLGVLLHELLTDRLPMDVKGATTAELLVRIASFEPQPIGQFDRSLRGDLETIVLTALAREKERRYPSAQALADDLRRVLAYEPITARVPTRWYRSRKFIRRHRVALGVMTAFVLMLAAATVISWTGFARASRERDAARAINAFLQEMISSADPEGGTRDVTVLQALDSAEERIGPTFRDKPALEGELRSKLAWMYQNLGQYDRADKQMTRAIELRTAALGPADERTLGDQAMLATILRWRYRPREAGEVAQRAYDLAVRNLGQRHRVTLGLLEPLAGVAMDLGDLDGAERQYRKLIEENKVVAGESDNITLTAMNNLAVILSDRGRYSEAEPILRRLLELRQRALPPGSLSLIITRHNLAVALSASGNFAEAERQLRSLAADAEKFLGPDHETTLSIRSSLAQQLQDLGRIDEALAMLRDVVDRQIGKQGVQHDVSIRRLTDYAIALLRAQRFDEARQCAQRSLDAAATLHGEDHPLALAARNALAGALDGLNQHAEAQKLYRRVVEDYTKQYGQDHQQTLMAQSNLALSLINSGDGSEALAILQPVLERALKNNIAFMEPKLRRNIGRALLGEKRYPEAERELLKAYELSKSRQEAGTALNVAEALSKLYDEWNRPQEAQRWRGVVATLK